MVSGCVVVDWAAAGFGVCQDNKWVFRLSNDAKGSLKTRLRSVPRIKHAGEAAGVDAWV